MKVQPFDIVKTTSNSVLVQTYKAPLLYPVLHQHKEIQLSYIINGTGKIIAGNKIHSFTNGDLFVIGAHVPHLFKSSPSESDAEMLSIFFSIDGFRDLISIAELQPLLDFMANCGSGFIVLSNRKKLYKLMSKMANTHGLKKFIAFLKCISKLEKVRKESLADAMNFRKISSGHGQRMQVVMDYVLHHFHENITIKEVANLVFLTPNAFSRYFKQRTNKSFVAFLIEVRIAHACHLLIHSELSIGAIATAAGFSATSNFNKQFKVLKSCTPRAFKRARIHTT